jgi:DNA mismatch repair protein MutS
MIIDDYIDYTNLYKEKYGEKCLVLMQVGSFYEVYSITDDTSGFIYNIADICNIQISKKNKALADVSISNPLMAGFPVHSIKKFTNILLNHNYTIVLIEQVTDPPSPQRKVTEILSPGMNINVENKRNNFMMVVYYEYNNNLPVAGIAGIDLSTGNTFVYEAGSKPMDPEFTNDEVFRLLTTYNPCEIVFLSDKHYDYDKKSYLLKNLNLSNILTHYKWDKYEYISQMTKLSYQNSILEKAFSKNNMLSISESINIERYYFGRIALCCLLQFAYEHNSDIIKQLNNPEVLNDISFLNIEYNSAVQLNIISVHQNDKPLVDILNRCNTSFGSRAFRDRLLNPIISIPELNKRYDEIEFLLHDKKFQNVSKHLCNILDLERLKRKMLIQKMQPCDWYGFHSSIEHSLSILEKYYNDHSIQDYKDMIDFYQNILNIDEASKYNTNDIKGNIFVKGVYTDIDTLVDEFNISYNVILQINKKINNLADGDATACKIDYVDKDGYFIIMTKRRFETAKKQDPEFMKDFQTKSLATSNNVKIVNNEINTVSRKMYEIQSNISNSVIKYYKEFVSSFIEKYSNLIDCLKKNITNIDIACCNAKNAYEYRYYRPSVVDNESSYIKAKGIRHPIIERINDSVEYIGNDFELSYENKNGMLLYGINAAGKSTLMKSIGLNVVMAQCGMFVPSQTMEYSPYKHIFTRISGMDNIYKGMSSFTVEMTELRNILQRCNKNSLVLGDEICNGTEAISALSIVAAGIKSLIKNKAGFIFATHLHDLTDIKVVKSHIGKYIGVYHIHISVDDNNTIIYDRILKEGKGIDTYGIEVCKTLDMPIDFMKTAESIRKEISGYNSLLTNPMRSKYNNSLYMSQCAICKTDAIDTHHINYQSMSDDDGFFTNFHQNIKHNLMPLCKECHIKHHSGVIKIKGYKSTSTGRVVDYEIINYHKEETEIEDKEAITEDEIEVLKQYVRRGKCNWFLRSVKTNIFKECSNMCKIEAKINKLLKRNVVNDLSKDTILSNSLHDPTL